MDTKTYWIKSMPVGFTVIHKESDTTEVTERAHKQERKI